MKKKCLTWMLLAALVLTCLVGCGENAASEAEKASETETASVQTEVPAEATEAAEEPASAQEASAAEESVLEAEPLPELAVKLPLEETATITIWDVFPPPLVGYMEGPWDCSSNALLEEATNVKLEYTTASTEVASEQFNLMVATGIYCDLIYGVNDFYPAGADAAIADDIIIDVKDMAATLPNYQALLAEFPDAEELTPGGHMYRFPLIATEQFSDLVQGMSTRGDWLSELGAEPPETYEEFHDLLLDYKNSYGGGTYLMDASGFSPALAGGFGITNDFYQVDGQIKYGPMEEGYREYVEYAQNLYAEGLLCPDFYTLFGPPTDLISNGTVGIWTCDVGMWNMFTSGIDTEGYTTIGFANPLKTPGEKTHFSQEVTRISEGFSISTGCEDLDLMAAYINYLYSDEFALIANYGKEGEGFEYDEAGNPHLSDLVLHNTETITSFAVKKYTLFSYLPRQDIQTRFADAYDEQQLDTIELWTNSGDSAYLLPSAFSLDVDDSNTVAALMSDIETSVDEYLLGFITGSIPLSQYDQFLAGLSDMGIQEAIDIYQAALDQYEA